LRNANQGFKLPMDWATDEQLNILRRELSQDVARLEIYSAATELSNEVVALKQVENEMQLRGIE